MSEYSESEKKECLQDEDGNIIDPITNEIIPEGRLIIIKSGNGIYCFDIDTLYKLLRQNPNALNPYTRTPFSENVIKEIKEYGHSLKRTIQIKSLHLNTYEFTIDADISLGRIILDIFHHNFPGIGSVVELFRYNFTVRTINDEVKSIYDYNLTIPLIDTDIKDSKTPNGIITIFFLLSDLGGPKHRPVKIKAMHRWYQFAKAERLDWLMDMIPEEYRMEETEREKKNYNELMDLIYNYDGSFDDFLGILISLIGIKYILLTAHQARTLISLLPYDLSPEQFKLIASLLLSRVIDRNHLNPNNELEKPYYSEIAPFNYLPIKFVEDTIKEYYPDFDFVKLY